MSKILDALLFIGPALALVLGLVFAFASSRRMFAWRPRQFAIGLAIPMLVSIAGAWRLRTVEADISVVLTVIAIAIAACAIGFAVAFGFGVLLRMSSQWFAERGGRSHFGDTGVSTLIARRSRRKGLPPGPRIPQEK